MYLRPAHAIFLVASIVMIAAGTVWVADGFRIAGGMPTQCFAPVQECTVAHIGEATSARMTAAVGGFLVGAGAILLVYVLVALVAVAATVTRERSGARTAASPGRESWLSGSMEEFGGRGSAILIAAGALVGLAAVFWAAAGSWCGGGDPMPPGSLPGIIYYGNTGYCHGTLSAFPPMAVDLAAVAGGLFGTGLLILVFAL